MKSIVFIVPKLSQPRCIKRIKTVMDARYSCKVYGFDDGSYNTDLNSLPFKIDELLSIPWKSNRLFNSLTARLYPYFLLQRIFIRHREESIFYVFGFDLAKVLYRIGCRNYIYEEADINSSKYKNKIKRYLSIRLDKRIAKKALLTIYTSEGFVDFLFPKEYIRPAFLVVPNKLNIYFKTQERESIRPKYDINKLRFGFVGLIRYPKTIFRFASIVAKSFPNYEFHFYGGKSSGLVVPDTLLNQSNVFFHGPFSNPSDLKKIYESIDVNIACYDTRAIKSSINVKVAEPNKLYESIYFKTPLIVSKGTFVGDKVIKLGIGEAIDASDEKAVFSFITSLTEEKLNTYSKNSAQVATYDLIDNPNELLERLATITGR